MDKKAFEKSLDQVINVPHEEPGPEEIGPEETIESMPSAQHDLQPTCNQLATDCISRQDAIDAIVKCTNCNTPEVLKEYVAEHSLWDLWSGGVLEALEALEAVEDLPSAQPESCGDVISREYLKEHIKACWTNGRPRYAPELNEVLSWIDDVPSARPKSPCTVCQEFDCYGCKFRRTT